MERIGPGANAHWNRQAGRAADEMNVARIRHAEAKANDEWKRLRTSRRHTPLGRRSSLIDRRGSQSEPNGSGPEEMKELVIISGKGGTGKTSLAAAFAVLAERPVIADCDVDAADLHLVLSPSASERHEFRSGHTAVVRQEDCSGCAACLAHCRFNAVRMNGKGAGEARSSVDPVSCEGCGVCVHICPEQAIDFPERICGEWTVSETRCGPMVHARLGVAAENSGRLVSMVRREARRVAEDRNRQLVIVDGPPGIGCPVIN